MVSALLVISVIDYRTMLIPVGAELVILAVGAVHLIFHLNDWTYYVIGFLAVGLFLLLCAFLFRALTGKSGLGLGDIELMACASLCIGWGHGLFAIILGSLLGVLVETGKILITKEKGKFPFGPYLSMGILAAVLWGDSLYDWYMTWMLG
jgi:leader peptidase (prepilin peptidase)/N-methyltransferase